MMRESIIVTANLLQGINSLLDKFVKYDLSEETPIMEAYYAGELSDWEYLEEKLKPGIIYGPPGPKDPPGMYAKVIGLELNRLKGLFV